MRISRATPFLSINVSSAFGRQKALLSNAGAITAGNLFTAALGFVYWWLAARAFSPSEVGFAAGAVSVMNLLAQIGEFGMGPLLISELPGRAKTAGAFISAALAATIGSSFLLAILFVAFAHATSAHLGRVVGATVSDAVFVFGVVATAFTVVLDQAFVGLLRSGYQLLRTSCFAMAKLLMLIVVAVCVSGPGREAALFATWIAGSVLSAAVLAAIAGRRGRRVWHAPDLNVLRPLVGRVLGHHALNVAIQAPVLVLPFVVTVLLSPEVNAAFYAAWTIVNVVLLVPASLSAVVVSVARHEPEQLGSRFGVSLMASAVVAACASGGCLMLSRFVLGLFNPTYAVIAGSSLALLGFGTLGMTVKYHFVAAERIRNHTWAAACVLALGGIFEVGAALIGAREAGLSGFTCGWLTAVTLEAIVLSPTLVRILLSHQGDNQPALKKGGAYPATDIDKRSIHAAT